MFIVGPGVRVGGEGMPTGSSGWQENWYPVSTPLVTVGARHEKLRLIVVTDVIRNISGGSGATREGNGRISPLILNELVHPKCKIITPIISEGRNEQPISNKLVHTYHITKLLTLVPHMEVNLH